MPCRVSHQISRAVIEIKVLQGNCVGVRKDRLDRLRLANGNLSYSEPAGSANALQGNGPILAFRVRQFIVRMEPNCDRHAIDAGVHDECSHLQHSLLAPVRDPDGISKRKLRPPIPMTIELKSTRHPYCLSVSFSFDHLRVWVLR
jgi:hypothetical protein